MQIGRLGRGGPGDVNENEIFMPKMLAPTTKRVRELGVTTTAGDATRRLDSNSDSDERSAATMAVRSRRGVLSY